MGAKTDSSMDARDKQMAASGRARRAEKIRRDELREAIPEIDDGSFSMDEGSSRGFEGAINRSRRGRRGPRGRRGGPRGGGRPPMFGGDPRRGGERPPMFGGGGRPPFRGGGRPPVAGDPRRFPIGGPRRGGGRPPISSGSNSQYETNPRFRALMNRLMASKRRRDQNR